MPAPPFRPLPNPRTVDRPDLPEDLRAFYTANEGFDSGLEPEDDAPVRLWHLAGVRRVGWGDVPLFGRDDYPDWADFDAVEIGASLSFDRLYSVLRAPHCPPGSVLAIGAEIEGPPGADPNPAPGEGFGSGLVLGASFAQWIEHSREHGWNQFGLYPGELESLPDTRREAVEALLKALNPNMGG